MGVRDRLAPRVMGKGVEGGELRSGHSPRSLSRSSVAIAMMLLIAVTASLFAMWSLYLLGRFAIAFFAASRGGDLQRGFGQSMAESLALNRAINDH